MRETPLWYYGDEVALEGAEDPDNRRSSPQRKFAPEGRTEESDLFEYVKRLMHWRRRSLALQRGDLRILHARGQQLVSTRTHKNESVLVALNNSRRAVRLTIAGRELRRAPLSALVEEATRDAT
jgi:glycosidase